MRTTLLTASTRLLIGHRRLVATVSAMACVLCLAVIASGRDQPRTTVLVTTDRVEAGRLLTAADLAAVAVPAGLVPDGALTDPAQAVDRMTAATLPRGSIVTDDALVSGGGRTSGQGRLILPLAVEQPDLMALIKPGDRITLLVTDGATGQTTVASDVLVAMASPAGTDDWLGNSGPDHILVDVSAETATLLASASVTARVTIALN
ncbi:MAG: SAF domain-containing protein [Propionibacteriaceae bacterium]|jgi:Flp pilus assembly protein CpaB|nr:SAF domain-containing protein [Propionibacteriaceae bacterium]